MADININEYVRTEKGSIGKFKSYGIDDVDEKIVYFKNNKGTTCVDENEIVKHSPNIIDLIEVGDYVNGRLVLQVDYKNKNVCLLIPLTDTLANTNIMWYGYEDIKTVVTHEQISNIEYRLEN